MQNRLITFSVVWAAACCAKTSRNANKLVDVIRRIVPVETAVTNRDIGASILISRVQYALGPRGGTIERLGSCPTKTVNGGKSMRKYIFAMCAAALFALPTSVAFSQVDVEVGPGGVHVGPGYHRHYYNRYEGGRCRELRAACMHKEELGERGMGNCRRYRELCG